MGDTSRFLLNNTLSGKDPHYSDPITAQFEYDQRHAEKPTSRPKTDERRRKQRGKYCIQCKKFFTGHGARFTADNHQFWTGHDIVSGDIAVTSQEEAKAKRIRENASQAQ